MLHLLQHKPAVRAIRSREMESEHFAYKALKARIIDEAIEIFEIVVGHFSQYFHREFHHFL